MFCGGTCIRWMSIPRMASASATANCTPGLLDCSYCSTAISAAYVEPAIRPRSHTDSASSKLEGPRRREFCLGRPTWGWRIKGEYATLPSVRRPDQVEILYWEGDGCVVAVAQQA